jgi:hypothetical protein
MELDTKIQSKKKSSRKSKVLEYVIDETVIKIGSEPTGYGLQLIILQREF